MKHYSVKAAGHRPKHRHKEPVVIPEVHFPPGELVAYTDGSTFRRNPGPIGWAVLYVRDNDDEMDPVTFTIPWQLVGAHKCGSSTRAELMAIVWALEHAPHENLTIRSDSLVTINTCNGLWTAHKNNDLWARYERVMERRTRHGLVTTFEHVRGHYQDRYNKRVDKLASEHLRTTGLSIIG